MSRPGPVETGGRVSRVQQWTTALSHLQTALRILDESEAPPHIGAELDLAINRLNDAIHSRDHKET